MLKPLLLVLGAVALVGVLMLGGWALTAGSPDVAPRQAPAPDRATDGASGAAERAGEPSQRQAGDVAQPREQQDVVAQDARARDVARRPRQRSSLTGAAAPTPARRRAGRRAPSLRPAQDATNQQRAVEAARLADRRRAEVARRTEVARRAEEAKQAADRARDDAEPYEPEGD